jgi:DNA polymerase-3 subunit delta'
LFNDHIHRISGDTLVMANAILPMPPFSWQRSVWDEFFRRVENDQLPHAFLLSGQEGLGAEPLAMAMAQYILCLSPAGQMVCGKCRSCQLLASASHPDLNSVIPADKGKQIKVDQIRDIADFVSKTAQQGGYKVVLIFPAESMNNNAANALLKNLEEPSGKTVFILVSQNPSRLLPTIRSRCAKIVLSVPPKDESLAWLEAVGVKDDAEALLAETHGAPILAKEWHHQGVMQERNEILKGLLDIAKYTLEPMVFAKKLGSGAPMAIVEVMQNSVDMMLSSVLAGRPLANNYLALAEMLPNCSHSTLFRLRDRLCEKKSQLLGPSNLNPVLFIEELVLDWTAVTKPSTQR